MEFGQKQNSYMNTRNFTKKDFFFFFSDPDLIFNTGTDNTPSPADNDRSPPETTHRRNARAEHTRAQKARRVADLCCDCPECNLLLATMRLERFLLLGLRPHWRVSRCFCPRWRRGHRPRYRALCAQAAASASSISTVSRGGSRRARCATRIARQVRKWRTCLRRRSAAGAHGQRLCCAGRR